MNGYEIKEILTDEVLLVPSKPSPFLIIITLLGITFLVLVVLTKFRIITPPETTFYVFLGFGLGFAFAGPLFMMRKTPDSIVFSKTSESVIFSEKEARVALPFSQFIRFDISGRLSPSENSGPSYTLDLVSKTGSRLTLKESDTMDELTALAEKLVPCIDIDIRRQNTVMYQGKGNYREQHSSLPDPSLSSVQLQHLLDTDTYTWKSRKTLWSLFFVAAVFTGMNIMFFFWAFPAMSSYNIGKYFITIFMAFIDILLLFIIAYNAVGISKVTVSKEYFAYEQFFFGFKISSHVLPRDSIALISSGFSGNDNKMTIFSREGKTLHDTLIMEAAQIDRRDRQTLFTLIPKLMQLRNEIIEIDGSPLYFYEKLLLEKLWVEKLQLPENSGL